MSPGRQKVSDEDVFAAAQRAMTRQGPHELTLADIAAEAGVSAGRLVQRFGSKRALLLALAERFAGSAGAVFAGLRAAHRQPLATLRAYAACMADLAVTPEACRGTSPTCRSISPTPNSGLTSWPTPARRVARSNHS